MRILKKDDALPELLPLGGWSRNPVINAVRDLEVGQSLVFGVEEWKSKTPPSNMINNSFKKVGKKFAVNLLKDRTGWVAKRIK